MSTASPDTTIWIRTLDVQSGAFTVPQMTEDEWIFVIVTRSSAEEYKLFFNGIESSTGALTVTGDFPIDQIGARENSDFLTGKMKKGKGATFHKL